MAQYKANVFVKDELREITNPEKDRPQRIIGEELKDYLFDSKDTKVCILYGLRRTGKTTLMLQTISELTQDDFEKSAYIEVSNRDTISSLYSDLDMLKEEGYKYIFIDEVTSLDNFISMSSLFPDVYVRKGMRIVLTGTDSPVKDAWLTIASPSLTMPSNGMTLPICTTTSSPGRISEASTSTS